MGSADLAPLRRWLVQHTGLQAELLGRQRLERAVARRLHERGCSTPDHYQQLLLQEPQEQQQLLEGLVVGESWFLREPRSFTQLQELAWRLPQRPLRLLSCGCASGEEPFSMVMTLLEAGLMRSQMQVEAIDLSAVALERAATGVYGPHALRGMEPQRLARHFQPNERHWRLRPEIGEAVRFHRGSMQRLLADLPGGWAAVFCRNVLLYLEDDARRELLMAIAGRLHPEGMLVVAAAEAPMVSGLPFQRLPGGHGAAFGLQKPEPVVEARPAAVPLALTDPDRHLSEARQLRHEGRRDEAMKALRRCLYLEPSRLEAMELMTVVARELGRPAEAERQARRLERNRRLQER